MREWARDNGKTVQQTTVREETTKYKARTLSLNMYNTDQQFGEKVEFDGNEDKEGAAEADKYDESDTDPESNTSDDELTNQYWLFLRTNIAQSAIS